MTGSKMKDQSSQSRALEGLPPKFVTAMRTLFDVLDDNKSGTVSLADIEHWWRKDRDEHGGGSVPNGVIESLRWVLISCYVLIMGEYSSKKSLSCCPGFF